MKLFNEITKIKITQIIILACFLLLISKATPKSNSNSLLKQKFHKSISDYYKKVSIAFYDNNIHLKDYQSFEALLNLRVKIINGEPKHTIIFCPSDFPDMNFEAEKAYKHKVFGFKFGTIEENDVGFFCENNNYKKLRISQDKFLIVPFLSYTLGFNLDVTQNNGKNKILITNKNRIEFDIFNYLYNQIQATSSHIYDYAVKCVN